MSSGPLLERLDALIDVGERMRSFRFPEAGDAVYQLGPSNRAKLRDWKDSCLSLIREAVGEESELYRAFPVDYPDDRQGAFHAAMDHYLCVLRVLREMIGGRPEEPPADAVAPYIVEGARRLFEAGYKDAAAVYCRVALEVFLRGLSKRSGVGFEARDSINKMAQRLLEAAVLGEEEWRAIERWSTFANAAAYQKFSQYTAEKVGQMIGWLEKFTGRAA